MLLIGVDPGGATGIAALGCDDRTPAHLLFHATCTEDQVVAALEHCRRTWAPDGRVRLIMERFDLRKDKVDVDLTPKQVQGRVCEWAETHRIPLFWQMPQERTMVTREVLLNLGLWLPGKHNRHIRDGTRHVITHLERALHMPTIRKGWPE